MRGLLRAFLSPAVADRYASALQPIAVADRDAALAGAVSTLRARFFVLPEELAVVLVEDAGWAVADVSTLLGLPTLEVRAALRGAAAASPRIGATPPADLDTVDDEAAAVEAMLADLPGHRRDAATAAEEPDASEQVDVDLSTTLPGYLGPTDLAARSLHADRVQRRVVNGTIVTVLVLVAAALQASRPAPEVALPDDDRIVVDASPDPTSGPTSAPGTSASPQVSDPTPTAAPSPQDDLPVGPPQLAAARFVAAVEPSTGEPGRTLREASPSEDPRLWLRFAQMPEQDLLLQLTFTAPSGRSTVRPVLITGRIELVSVRLPDELGRTPGRYAARIEADGMEPEVVELEIVAEADTEADADADADAAG